MKVALLAGGTGGAKLAHGFQMALPPGDLTVIVNVGDDTEPFGLLVCPDLDTILYTGASLTDAAASMAASLGVSSHLVPATDDRLRTVLQTDAGELDFQAYFVQRAQRDEVHAVRFDGVEAARPSPAALSAVVNAEMVVIGPSNPIVSIGPILALPGMREALLASPAPRIGVSGIVAGKALRGPADRMLTSLGHESSDDADVALAPAVEALGMAVSVLPTVMRNDEDRAGLAGQLVALGEGMLRR